MNPIQTGERMTRSLRASGHQKRSTGLVLLLLGSATGNATYVAFETGDDQAGGARTVGMNHGDLNRHVSATFTGNGDLIGIGTLPDPDGPGGAHADAVSSQLSMPPHAVEVRPAGADTAWVRGLLEAAQEELRTASGTAAKATSGRLGRVWAQWGDPVRGAGVIAAAASTDPAVPFELEEALYRPWLDLVITHYMSGDTAAARRDELTLGGEARDGLRMQLSIRLLRSGRLQEADSLLLLIDDRLRRTRAVLEGTRVFTQTGLTHDDVVAWLQEELESIEHLSGEEVPNVRLYVHARLLEMGLQLTPEEVATTLTSAQAQRNLGILADQLRRRGREAEAKRYLDAALSIADARSDMGTHESFRSRIAILIARNEPGDSARAAQLGDSLLLASPPAPMMIEAARPALDAWYRAVEGAQAEGDFMAVRELLVTMDQDGYPEEALWQAVHTGFDLWRGRYRYPSSTFDPPNHEELGNLLPLAWSLGSGLEPALRDSIRLHLVVPSWGELSVDSALAKALELETRRFRERALAGFLNRIDLDKAASLTTDFVDVAAINRAFSGLTVRYLRAGEVALAQVAAERTVSGDSRVRALALVADARWALGDTAVARELIRAAVDELADEALCEGHCEVIVGPGGTLPPASTPPSLLDPVIATAYVIGETAALETWAGARTDADARARGYIRIAEVVHRVHAPDAWLRPRWGIWAL